GIHAPLRLRHHPDGAPDLAPSPRRIEGGANTVPDCNQVGRLLLCWPLRSDQNGGQNGGCPNISSE
ncbi:hypothetical protein, partial [Aeromonas sp. R9-1]|uniref:hypothetical protein n=1 Tax=Aeromonas sp. R9-1 TaxID=3138478 RepID=UPI0034A58E5E